MKKINKTIQLFNDLFDNLSTYYYVAQLNNIERVCFDKYVISRSIYPNTANYKIKVDKDIYILSIFDNNFYITLNGEEVSNFKFKRTIKKLARKIDYKYNYVPVIS